MTTRAHPSHCTAPPTTTAEQHDAKTTELQHELKAVESVARARSTMLSYSRTPVPVRNRSLSLDQTLFIKEKKSVEEEAAQYNQWRRETSETDLFGE